MTGDELAAPGRVWFHLHMDQFFRTNYPGAIEYIRADDVLRTIWDGPGEGECSVCRETMCCTNFLNLCGTCAALPAKTNPIPCPKCKGGEDPPTGGSCTDCWGKGETMAAIAIGSLLEEVKRLTNYGQFRDKQIDQLKREVNKLDRDIEGGLGGLDNPNYAPPYPEATP